jgi:hypothetical protein
LHDIKIETPHGQVYSFYCNKWLDRREGDGEIERVLYPEERGAVHKEENDQPSSMSHFSLH